MRSCGNCFWSFSPIDEEMARKEYNGEDYDLDLNVSKAGDCCLGVNHNNKYYCSAHSYDEGAYDYQEYMNLGIDKYVSIDLYNAIKASLLELSGDDTKIINIINIDEIVSLLVYDLFGGEIYCDVYDNKIHYYNVIDGNIIDLTKDSLVSKPSNYLPFKLFPKMSLELLERYKKFLLSVRNNICDFSFEQINGDFRIQRHKEYLDSLCIFSTFEIDDYYIEDGVEYVQFDLSAQNTGNVFRYKHNLSTDEYELCDEVALNSWETEIIDFPLNILESIFDIARDNKENIKTLNKLKSINSHK